MKFPDEEQVNKAADAAVRTFSLKNNGWNAVLASILKIPGARVDRTAFLRDVFDSLPQGSSWLPAETVHEIGRASCRERV